MFRVSDERRSKKEIMTEISHRNSPFETLISLFKVDYQESQEQQNFIRMNGFEGTDSVVAKKVPPTSFVPTFSTGATINTYDEGQNVLSKMRETMKIFQEKQVRLKEDKVKDEKIKTLEEQIGELKTKVTSLEKDNASLRTRANNRANEHGKKMSDLASKNKELSDKFTKVDEERKNLSDKCTKLEEQQKRLQSEYDEIVKMGKEMMMFMQSSTFGNEHTKEITQLASNITKKSKKRSTSQESCEDPKRAKTDSDNEDEEQEDEIEDVDETSSEHAQSVEDGEEDNDVDISWATSLFKDWMRTRHSGNASGTRRQYRGRLRRVLKNFKCDTASKFLRVQPEDVKTKYVSHKSPNMYYTPFNSFKSYVEDLQKQ